MPAGRLDAMTHTDAAGASRLSVAAATLLSVIAALHACWGLGSAWPARDRTRLAQLSSGQDEMPPPAACFAVATLLAAHPERFSR